MNTSKVIGGIICLVIALGLAALMILLPEGKFIFMVSGVNMPYIPSVVLGVIGIVMLASPKEENEKPKEDVVIDEEKEKLNKQMETIAWGCFLIMLGCFLFVPEEIIKGGWWSIGVGAIFLGLNLARYLRGLRMSGFTTFLGVVSIASGILDLVTMESFTGAIMLIVLGGYLILKPMFDQRQVFGEAAQK